MQNLDSLQRILHSSRGAERVQLLPIPVVHLCRGGAVSAQFEVRHVRACSSGSGGCRDVRLPPDVPSHGARRMLRVIAVVVALVAHAQDNDGEDDSCQRRRLFRPA